MSSETASRNGAPLFDTGLTSYTTFTNFRAVILSAIATAWIDSDFRTLLKEEPKRALKEKFGYNFPYDLELICNPDSADYEPALVNDWVAKHFSSIEIVLPPAPAEEQRGVALAEYNLKHLTFLTRRHIPTAKEILSLLKTDEGHKIIFDIINKFSNYKNVEGSAQ